MREHKQNHSEHKDFSAVSPPQHGPAWSFCGTSSPPRPKGGLPLRRTLRLREGERVNMARGSLAAILRATHGNHLLQGMKGVSHGGTTCTGIFVDCPRKRGWSRVDDLYRVPGRSVDQFQFANHKNKDNLCPKIQDHLDGSDTEQISWPTVGIRSSQRKPFLFFSSNYWIETN